MSAAVLAFDTSGPYCAAALHIDGALVCTQSRDMTRGQAEFLMPMLEDLLTEHGLAWRDLARIGVGIGPGNFTGIRIAVSAARGLALGLGVPAIGVSTFDALRLKGAPAMAVPAPRDMAYLVKGDADPQLCATCEVPMDAAWPTSPEHLVDGIATLAAQTSAPFTPPAPLYLRAADAAPARDAPPVILDDA